MAFAKAMIIGNLGRDPEMRYLPSGRPVTEFSVAVSHSKPDGNGGWVDEGTDWYRVTVWGDRAERTAEQFRKGNKVFVEGRFRTREFEGRDGQKRTALEITADNVRDYCNYIDSENPLYLDPVHGVSSRWGRPLAPPCMIGTAIIADPRQVTGFGEAGKDRYLLLDVKPNEPFTYFLGAAWAGNRHIRPVGSWEALLRTATWGRLNEIYAPKSVQP